MKYFKILRYIVKVMYIYIYIYIYKYEKKEKIEKKSINVVQLMNVLRHLYTSTYIYTKYLYIYSTSN